MVLSDVLKVTAFAYPAIFAVMAIFFVLIKVMQKALPVEKE